MPVVAVDFDGVIHSPDGSKFGGEVTDAQPSLKRLQRMGYDIVVHSARATDHKTRQIISVWMYNHKMPFTEVTNVKPLADFYIDDKAIYFTNWKEVFDVIKSR